MYGHFGSFLPYADGRFIDNEDLVQQLEDPTSKVMQSMLAGLGRNRDVIILGANGNGGIFGTYQFQNSAGAYATGAANANVIPSNTTFAHEDETILPTEGGDGFPGLTIGKLILAKMQLDNSEVEDPEPGDRPSNYHIAVTATQLGNLLAIGAGDVELLQRRQGPDRRHAQLLHGLQLPPPAGQRRVQPDPEDRLRAPLPGLGEVRDHVPRADHHPRGGGQAGRQVVPLVRLLRVQPRLRAPL